MTNKPAPPDKNFPQESEPTPSVPSKMNQILQELEVMSLSKGSLGGIDVNFFDKDQRGKLLDLMAKNEDNAIKYHTDRINVHKEIELARIASANTNNKTVRYVTVAGLILVVAVTVLILLFKDGFFIPWLTFLTGFVGGVGALKVVNALKASEKTENPIKAEENPQ